MKDRGVYRGGDGQGSTSLTLLDLVRRRDPAAWGRFVELYSPLVFYWCHRAGLRPSDAEDVGQEVFIAVHRAIEHFEYGRNGATFRTWLSKLTRSKIFDQKARGEEAAVGGTTANLRILNAVPASVDADGAGETDGADDDRVRDLNILYCRAVGLMEATFEESTRRAFWMVMEGRPPDVVAAELGMSVGAVYTAKSKVLKRLRREFQDIIEPLAPEGGGG